MSLPASKAVAAKEPLKAVAVLATGSLCERSIAGFAFALKCGKEAGLGELAGFAMLCYALLCFAMLSYVLLACRCLRIGLDAPLPRHLHGALPGTRDMRARVCLQLRILQRKAVGPCTSQPCHAPHLGHALADPAGGAKRVGS